MPMIYGIRNKIDGRIYIGQTKNTLSKRMSQHIASAKSGTVNPLHDAMRECGIENFEGFEIESGDFCKEELDEKEIKYISEFDALYPNGYNIFKGGDFRNLSEESKMKISKKLKGREIAWSGKVSETMKEKWKDKDYREHMRRTHMKNELPVNDAIELYKSGKTINYISKMYGVSFKTVKEFVTNGS